jgi:hypothetical protein
VRDAFLDTGGQIAASPLLQRLDARHPARPIEAAG